MNKPHIYKVQLIRRSFNHKDCTVREIAELEKTVDTFARATEVAFSYGARPRSQGDELPKMEGTRAVYPCKDKRFARVQIVIVPVEKKV